MFHFGILTFLCDFETLCVFILESANHLKRIIMNKLRKMLSLVVLLTCVLFTSAISQVYPEDAISLTEVTKHIKFLASDELKGRETGKPGNDVAARYIAEQFRASGLISPESAEDYFQKVPLEKLFPVESGQFIIFADTLMNGVDMIVLTGEKAEISGDLVDVGFGWIDSTENVNDYEGLDINGKIALARIGIPGRDFGPSTFSASSTKRKFALDKGAVAFVELYNGNFPWRGLMRFLSRERLQVVNQEEGAEADQMVHLLVNDADSSFSAKIAEHGLATASIKSSGRTTSKLFSNNVVGLVEGTDPVLKNEYLILMAHYDHVGVRTSPANADSIFNGARDNGIGTVALITAAKSLSLSPPKRSVLFLAVTGEEIGLLGSQYYVENPLIPLDHTIYALNTDSGGWTDTTIVTVIGLERTTAKDPIVTGTARFNLTAIADPVPEQNLFNRSDNVAFNRKGVPSITYSPGFREFGAEIMKFYHQPNDEADEFFDFVYLQKFCKAFTHSARLITDMDKRPFWFGGDEYEKISKKLYNME